MQTAIPLACLLSVIRPPGVQFENSLLQIAPIDKSKCPFVKNTNDVGFQLYTRHNPTVYQELVIGDDEKLFASNIDFNDKTVLYFHAFMEQPDDGSGIMIREAYVQRGDTNVIMIDAHHLEAGPWYVTAAQNTWYIGRFAAQFIDFLVTRGLNLNTTHLIGHSLGAQSAGVAGSSLKSGRVARITGLDPALPLFEGLPIDQRLDASDAEFVDVIHTDAGIFGYKAPIGHVDFYPNGGISPQPGCELEAVVPQQLLLNKCDGPQTDTRPNTALLTYDLLTEDRRAQSIEDYVHIKTNINAVHESKDVNPNNAKFGKGTILKISKREADKNLAKDTKIDKESTDNIVTKPNKIDIEDSNNKHNHKQAALPLRKLNPVAVIRGVYKVNRYVNDNIIKREKRFLPSFKRHENINAFSLLALLRNHRNVLPVVSLAREISTMIRNGHTELSHFSRETNSYIGAKPALFGTPFSYNIDASKGSAFNGFFKKFFGLGGDRLSVSSSG